jgi:hypothetical protein
MKLGTNPVQLRALPDDGIYEADAEGDREDAGLAYGDANRIEDAVLRQEFVKPNDLEQLLQTEKRS